MGRRIIFGQSDILLEILLQIHASHRQGCNVEARSWLRRCISGARKPTSTHICIRAGDLDGGDAWLLDCWIFWTGQCDGLSSDGGHSGVDDADCPAWEHLNPGIC